jgi:hypothetical protein
MKKTSMATLPVTDVNLDGSDRFAQSAQYDELSRIREMAGMPPARPTVGNKAAPINTKAKQKQNESIFTDTENLWKRYKG